MKKQKVSKIKLMRAHTGLSQMELAEMLGINQAAICYWEKFMCIPIEKHQKKVVEIANQYGYNLTIEGLKRDYIK